MTSVDAGVLSEQLFSSSATVGNNFKGGAAKVFMGNGDLANSTVLDLAHWYPIVTTKSVARMSLFSTSGSQTLVLRNLVLNLSSAGSFLGYSWVRQQPHLAYSAPSALLDGQGVVDTLFLPSLLAFVVPEVLYAQGLGEVPGAAMAGSADGSQSAGAGSSGINSRRLQQAAASNRDGGNDSNGASASSTSSGGRKLSTLVANHDENGDEDTDMDYPTTNSTGGESLYDMVASVELSSVVVLVPCDDLYDLWSALCSEWKHHDNVELLPWAIYIHQLTTARVSDFYPGVTLVDSLITCRGPAPVRVPSCAATTVSSAAEINVAYRSLEVLSNRVFLSITSSIVTFPSAVADELYEATAARVDKDLLSTELLEEGNQGAEQEGGEENVEGVEVEDEVSDDASSSGNSRRRTLLSLLSPARSIMAASRVLRGGAKGRVGRGASGASFRVRESGDAHDASEGFNLNLNLDLDLKGEVKAHVLNKTRSVNGNVFLGGLARRLATQTDSQVGSPPAAETPGPPVLDSDALSASLTEEVDVDVDVDLNTAAWPLSLARAQLMLLGDPSKTVWTRTVLDFVNVANWFDLRLPNVSSPCSSPLSTSSSPSGGAPDAAADPSSLTTMEAAPEDDGAVPATSSTFLASTAGAGLGANTLVLSDLALAGLGSGSGSSYRHGTLAVLLMAALMERPLEHDSTLGVESRVLIERCTLYITREELMWWNYWLTSARKYDNYWSVNTAWIRSQLLFGSIGANPARVLQTSDLVSLNGISGPSSNLAASSKAADAPAGLGRLALATMGPDEFSDLDDLKWDGPTSGAPPPPHLLAAAERDLRSAIFGIPSVPSTAIGATRRPVTDEEEQPFFGPFQPPAVGRGRLLPSSTLGDDDDVTPFLEMGYRFHKTSLVRRIMEEDDSEDKLPLPLEGTLMEVDYLLCTIPSVKFLSSLWVWRSSYEDVAGRVSPPADWTLTRVIADPLTAFLQSIYIPMTLHFASDVTSPAPAPAPSVSVSTSSPSVISTQSPVSTSEAHSSSSSFISDFDSAQVWILSEDERLALASNALANSPELLGWGVGSVFETSFTGADVSSSVTRSSVTLEGLLFNACNVNESINSAFSWPSGAWAALPTADTLSSVADAAAALLQSNISFGAVFSGFVFTRVDSVYEPPGFGDTRPVVVEMPCVLTGPPSLARHVLYLESEYLDSGSGGADGKCGGANGEANNSNNGGFAPQRGDTWGVRRTILDLKGLVGEVFLPTSYSLVNVAISPSRDAPQLGTESEDEPAAHERLLRAASGDGDGSSSKTLLELTSPEADASSNSSSSSDVYTDVMAPTFTLSQIILVNLAPGGVFFEGEGSGGASYGFAPGAKSWPYEPSDEIWENMTTPLWFFKGSRSSREMLGSPLVLLSDVTLVLPPSEFALLTSLATLYAQEDVRVTAAQQVKSGRGGGAREGGGGTVVLLLPRRAR